MSRRTTAFVASSAIALAAACVPKPEVLTVPPPGSARTAVYVVELEGRAPIVYVADLVNGTQPPLPELARRAGGMIAMTALHYACPADVLGLVPGVLPPLGEAEAGHPLPPAGESFSSTFDGAAQSSWTPNVEASPPGLRVSRKIACARFRLERLVIPDTNAFVMTSTIGFDYTPPTLGIVTGENELIVAVSDMPAAEGAPRTARFFRATTEGSQRLDVPANTPHLTYYRAPDGTIWLYGPGGRLASGDFTRGFTPGPTATSTRGRERAWIAGPASADDPFELFTLDDGGAFQHFDGTSWQVLHQFSNERIEGRLKTPTAIYGGVVWIRSGEAIAVSNWGSRAARWDGALHFDDVDQAGSSPQLPSLRMIGHYPKSTGTVVATSAAILFQKTGPVSWKPYYDSPLGGVFVGTTPVLDMEPLDEGVFFGGGGGRFTQYQPELEAENKYCNYRETKPVDGLMNPESLAEYHVFAIEPMPCGYALLSKQSTYSADVEINFLTRIP